MTCAALSGRGQPLVDGYGRPVSYLRVSVTDRCDLRCTYCMSEQMTFLPRRDLLTLEELDRLCSAFVARGVRRIRLTGGEPLVRRDVTGLLGSLARHLEAGTLDELTLTTNGTMLAHRARDLAACGVRRINVSLDTLDPGRYRAITRRGDLSAVLEGLDAAQAAGLSVKLNVVALRDVNEDELEDLIRFAHGRGMDLTLIEVMPLGEIGHDRAERFLPLDAVRRRLSRTLTLEPLDYRSAGPARYVRVAETGGRLGFITPLTHNFCEGCNRIRVTCAGMLYTCLGHEEGRDLRAALRGSEADEFLQAAIDDALAHKPRGHDFVADRLSGPAIARHMSVTGG